MYKKIPIRIGDSKDPDTGAPCKVLFLNENRVDWWMDLKTVEALRRKISDDPSCRDQILYTLLKHFMTVVQTGVQRQHLSFMEVISATESGWIRTGVLE